LKHHNALALQVLYKVIWSDEPSVARACWHCASKPCSVKKPNPTLNPKLLIPKP